jgi:hypothetical protein
MSHRPGGLSVGRSESPSHDLVKPEELQGDWISECTLEGEKGAERTLSLGDVRSGDAEGVKPEEHPADASPPKDTKAEESPVPPEEAAHPADEAPKAAASPADEAPKEATSGG